MSFASHARTSLAPFLYPFSTYELKLATRLAKQLRNQPLQLRCWNSTTSSTHLDDGAHPATANGLPTSRLNPPPDSYSLTPFLDRCNVLVHAGNGGHGCVSFLRDKLIANGPANGGDGGSGGNIYIQAHKGETSLHKIARKSNVNAGRGRNGQGRNKGGERGEDIILTVPVGTVVREVWRDDPMAEEERRWHREKKTMKDGADGNGRGTLRPDRWLLYPGAPASAFATGEFPMLPKPRRSHLAAMEPQPPVRVDLDQHMERPMLIVAGAMGGFGNPHFVSQDIWKPKMATRGEQGMKMMLQLELKLIADLGLVGLPNAGKSTLLRSLTNSQARIGHWAFTTLQPNIGTVVLDDYKGRSKMLATDRKTGERRTRFTIADIPGLIEGAHLDKGLGFQFLRHVERAAVLAFVVDLNAGDAVAALKALWNEVGEYETRSGEQLNLDTEQHGTLEWKPINTAMPMYDEHGNALISPEAELPPLALSPVTSKPWFVIATKADLPDTQENYVSLMRYVEELSDGSLPHPSGKANAWRRKVHAVPVSAINAEGVERISEVVIELLDM
ncbi:GTP-binding protein-like protein Obg [Aulographum hederae CBS 113979]|uniref:GTP-binding protein-like protein Obg n=1 Tax=Aulographum hederae CBS 113979 TaxID=1176131 RepID=A0A6G1HHE1_9PEZI|nr:GTP-binding protein-like protein Obg [Aulographum hederae CBS 113979]